MSGDPFRRVAAGQACEPTAAAWNAMLDALDFIKQLKSKGGGLNTERKNPLRLPIKNDSGEDRDQYDILGIDDILITPADNEDEFKAYPALKGVAVEDGHVGKFAVLQEPVKKDVGDLPKAVVHGLTICRIDYTPGDEFADAKPGDCTQLKSGSSGAAQILYVDAGDNNAGGEGCLALVRLGNRAPAAAKHVGPAMVRKLTLDGEQVWGADFSLWPTASSFLNVKMSDIVVANETVYVITSEAFCGASGANSADRTQVIALDPEDGKITKRIAMSGVSTLPNRPRIHGNDDYIIAHGGYVFDHNGDVAWSFTPGPCSKIGPDGLIYTQNTSAIRSYTIGNSTPVMDISSVTDSLRAIAFDGSNIYVGLDQSSGKELRCYTTGGSLVWDFEHGANVLAVDVDPTNGNVLMGGNNSVVGLPPFGTDFYSIRLLDSSGNLLWSAYHGDHDHLGGYVYAVACDGNDGYYVTCLRTMNNTPFTGSPGGNSDTTISTTRKYDISGNLVWALDHGEDTYGMVLHDGHLYICGTKSLLTRVQLEPI